jgi:hypothetical protein
MKKFKRASMLAVLVVAVAALALPLMGLTKARAAGSSTSARPASAAAKNAALNAASPVATQQDSVNQELPAQPNSGKLSPETLKDLGLYRLPKGADLVKVNASLRDRISGPASGGSRGGSSVVTPQSGQPLVLDARSALSAGLAITIGGRDNQFSEVALIADWDGREDCVADREQKQDDFSFAELEIDFTLTKVAISEHTFANGFAENVIYYGDSVGNFWVGTDLNPGVNVSPAGAVDTIRQVNIPALVTTGASGGFTLLNRPAGDCTDDQVTVTGIAVNPVADLGDFGLCGTIGEVVYVSVLDTEGCAAAGNNQIFRTRIIAFAFTDVAGGLAPAGALQILRNPLHHTTGITVDDDGSLYFQLADLNNLANGAAIFKVTELCRTVAGCAVNPRINRVIASIPSGLTGGIGLATATPLTAGGFRLTNYSGTSATFGNIVAMDAGPCNVLYAAVSASFVAGAVSFEQLTQGLFTNPAALGATPSMIISFADCSGLFDACSSPAPGIPGQIPVADGFSDGPGTVARVVGVNNFRVFAIGQNGPDIRPAAGATAAIITTGTLRVDMQIDYSPVHSGISVNQEGTVFVISGGLPAGIGKNSSPMLGEVLCFPDMCPMDRRGDFIDLRGDAFPNPPASGGNIGDGDSDRFDHIFYQSPLDQVTLTPGGLAGLADGFLLHTNRTRNRNAGSLASLPNGGTQGDDATSGVLIFEDFDAGHQVAGGDDQNTPFRGDDDNGLGTPPLVGALSGGFEFLFGGPVGTPGCVWNGFFLNSNGNITFGGGDTDNTPTVPELRTGLPRIAPAWADLNPASRAVDPCTFPVQALGFANVNAFKVRWINVPEFGLEGCTGLGLAGASNTFSVILYDDGTGVDENSNKLLDPADPTGDNVDPAFDLQEGPTDLQFVREPNTGVLVGCPPRPEGSGHFIFEYCRMDLLGTPFRPVIAGFSIGGLSPLNPPGLCEVNLSELARAADTAPFGVLAGGQTASIMPCLIGEGTEPTLFELFNEGADPSIGAGGEITFATPDFDLRFEGNDPAACTPTRQTDNNRGKVGFFGVGCLPPANPLCQVVVPGPFVTNPAAPVSCPGFGATSGLVNALCAVQLNLVGCGFFPNEVTLICQGVGEQTGQPIQRPGKTVSTAITLACDTNGDGIPEATVVLGTVTPINKNLVRGTLNTLAGASPALPGTAFPAACCGGTATVTVTTTFSAGDNNVFGPFTRTAVCVIALGTRAPILFSITPSNGNCGILQNLILTGACFLLPNGALNVTSVAFVDRANPNNVICVGPTRLKVLSSFLADVEVLFGTVNAGRSFLVFLGGPNGSSQNLGTLPVGAPAGCPLGNQQGIQVTFTCNALNPGGGGGTPPANVAVVNGCRADREADGSFSLSVFGRNIMQGARITVGGVVPGKTKFKGLETGTNMFTRVVLKKKVCNALPGVIIIENPGQAASQAFQCNDTCN